MQKFKELLKKEYEVQLSKNILELYNNIDTIEYQTKIKNYCKQFNFNIKEVNDKILSDRMFAMFFIKNPAKQNLVEKTIIKIFPNTKLPASGKKCVRFSSDGKVIFKKEIGCTKSADFLIDDVYFTQKYTNGCGGAQDNQYNDVVDFLSKGEKNKNFKVGAILDGDYWTESKISKLKKMFSHSKICSMEDLINEK